MDGTALGGTLQSRKSLVPRKTFMASLRSMALALPQVREHDDADKSLSGRTSYAQGASAATRPGDSRTEGTKHEQLLEVSAEQITCSTQTQCYSVFCCRTPTDDTAQMICWLSSERGAAML